VTSVPMDEPQSLVGVAGSTLAGEIPGRKWKEHTESEMSGSVGRGRSHVMPGATGGCQVRLFLRDDVQHERASAEDLAQMVVVCDTEIQIV